MNPARVLEMGLAEIAGRSVQALRKRFDRHGLGVERRSARGVLSALASDPDLDTARALARAGDLPGAGRRLLDRFVDTAPARFFAGATSDEVPAVFRGPLAHAGRRLRDSADRIMDGRFDLLGYRDLCFGDPPDWHLDPVSGRRAPLAHWSEIEYLDAGRAGDSKVIWELNRHQWLVRLGQAYRLTGDERYAERFAATVVDWRRANPPGLGINWASSLEVAFRIIAWSWALLLFRGSRALEPALYVEMLSGIAEHAGHVERYLSRYFSPNTHLTGEALGLCYAGSVFPELRAAGRWRRLGTRILVEQFRRQVLDDGVHFERSTCYHRYTVDIYLHFLLLAARSGAAVPRDIADGVARMVEVLVALRHPDGTMPDIGDADGGRLLPLSPIEPEDVRGVFATAAAVLGRGDFAWAAGGPEPDAVWLLGPAALASVAPRAPAWAASRTFPEGGYAVMRTDWDRRAHQLIVDVGPLGCPVTAGHGHADLLGIQCAVGGEPMIVDPGTYCYTAEPRWRAFFRGTGAHSTIAVDGQDQALGRGPFAWHSRPAARVRRALAGEVLDVIDAEHGAYDRLPDPVTHRRRVLWAKPDYWVLVDDLIGADLHDIDLRFQFAPIEVALDRAPWARARGASGATLLVRAFATAPLAAEVVAGSAAPIAGWVSAGYGRRQPAPVLIYTARARLPLRIATLLFPANAGGAEPPDVTPLRDDRAQLVGLAIGREALTFDEPESRTVVA